MGTKTFKYEKDQRHQVDAIASIVDLFKGYIRPAESDFVLDSTVYGNLQPGMMLEKGWLLKNVNDVRGRNSLGEKLRLDTQDGQMLEGIRGEAIEFPVFTIDMETGTGKTYVYVRAICELFKEYSFRKFIIVVPSIAVFENVIQSFESLKDHLKDVYGPKWELPLLQYDGGKPQMLKSFAQAELPTVLIMTIDSFNKKKKNAIFRRTDKLGGDLFPYEYIQQTRPILILDESQNYKSPLSREALQTLRPLFAMNFSATPERAKNGEPPNLIYNLSPYDAFRMDLVKKIEVLGLEEKQAGSQVEDYLKLVRVERMKGKIRATFEATCLRNGKLVQEEVVLSDKSDVSTVTNNPAYEGWIVGEINYRDKFVEFTNGGLFNEGYENAFSAARELIFRRQIAETISTHFRKQMILRREGVKVLSLFFIDRVASYVGEEAFIKRLFDEEFDRLKMNEPEFSGLEASRVREGYFAKKKATRMEGEAYVDMLPDREVEKAAFELIMKSKERLVRFDEPVSFIFSHSALREGWDNPNVFQICVLREIASENSRRQTIGRGLRIPVDQELARFRDADRNILTVVANESYASFANRLHAEFVESGDVLPDGFVKDAKKRIEVRRNQSAYQSREFRDFWEKLTRQTRYEIVVDSKAFIEAAIRRVNAASIPAPTIVITRARFSIINCRLKLERIEGNSATILFESHSSDGADKSLRLKVEGGFDLKEYPLLTGFKVAEVSGAEGHVRFSNGTLLLREKALEWNPKDPREAEETNVFEGIRGLPKCNLIDRAAKELSITRATVFSIFKGLQREQKEAFVRNPEGFAGVFIGTLRECLVEHIVERIEYSITDEVLKEEMEGLFPAAKSFPEEELEGGNRVSLYERVQVDSDNERDFVKRLNEDGNVIVYFKFPPMFKINIPKLIGNYNPDWGIVRWDDSHTVKLELVRETKGNEDERRLQFPDEWRKIRCAKKHFELLGISYRMVTGQTVDYWKNKV